MTVFSQMAMCVISKTPKLVLKFYGMIINDYICTATHPARGRRGCSVKFLL